jgi:hypothetical protein
MRIVQLLILTFLLSACRTENDKMLGHWHSVPFEDGSFWTLDVTDSTTQTNRYNHSRYQQEYNRIFNYKGEEILWIDYEEYRNIEIKNDTLLLNEHFRFIRVKETHHLHDHFPNSLVHLNLPRSTKSSETELPYRKSQLSHIYIGPPKETEMHSELINLDSTCFQILDFIATGYSDLEMFARKEDEKLHEDENYWLIIHADSTTTQPTIDTLLTLLEPLGVINGFIISKYNYKLDRIEYEELNHR